MSAAKAFAFVSQAKTGALAADKDGKKPSLEYLFTMRAELYKWIGQIDTRIFQGISTEEDTE